MERIKPESGFGYMTANTLPGGHLVTVSGTSPLALPHMAANGLRAITIDGNTIQSDRTPTPDSPSDIQAFGELITSGSHTGQYRILLNLTGPQSAVIPLYLDAPLFRVSNQADRIIVDFTTYTATVERRITYRKAPHGTMYGTWALERRAFGMQSFFSSIRTYAPGFCTHLTRSRTSEGIAFGATSNGLVYFYSRFFDSQLSDYGASNLNAWLDANNVMIAYISDITNDTGAHASTTDISAIQDIHIPSLRSGNYSISVSDNSDMNPSAVTVTFTARS